VLVVVIVVVVAVVLPVVVVVLIVVVVIVLMSMYSNVGTTQKHWLTDYLDTLELIHSKNFLKMSNLETSLLLLKIQILFYRCV